MQNQNLFEALKRVCNFIALESEMEEIKDAVYKDRRDKLIGYSVTKTCEHLEKEWDGEKLICSNCKTAIKR